MTKLPTYRVKPIPLIRQSATCTINKLEETWCKKYLPYYNFGLSVMKKSGSEYITDDLAADKKAAREVVKSNHQDHLHWSID